ncbi:MAG: hypothetical protein Kow00107_04660 [Planctomycetota bacterium]
MPLKRSTVLLLLVMFLFSLTAHGEDSVPVKFVALGTAQTPEFFLTFNARLSDEGQGVIFFDFADSDNYRILNIAGRRLALSECRAGKWIDLKTAEAKEPLNGELLLKRHSDYVSAHLDGRILISASISDAIGSVFGVGQASDTGLSFVRYQPLENVIFADSFMRTDSAGEWDIVSGFWEICGLSFSEMSANPFTLFARFKDSSKLESLGDGRTFEEKCGVGVMLDGSGKISRIAGQAPAAEAGLQQDDIIELVNGKPVYMVWGALENARVGEKFELDVRRGGKRFKVTLIARRYRWGEIEKRTPLSPATLEEDAFLRAGYPFWDDYTFEVTVRPMGEGMVGLAFYVRSNTDYFALRWWGDNSRRSATSNILELVRVHNGSEQVLASSYGGFYPDQFYRLRLVVAGQKVTAFIDGFKVLEADSNELCAGGIGLLASDGYGAYFDDVKVANNRIFRETPKRRRINEIWREQSDMRDWADPSTDWTRRFQGDGSVVFNYKYHIFGLTDIVVRPENLVENLVVSAFTDQTNSSGVTFEYDPREEFARISWANKSGNGRGSTDQPLRLDLEQPITIRVSKKSIEIIQDDVPRLRTSFFLTDGATGLSIGGFTSLVDRDGMPLVEVTGPGIRDYTFEESPSDWYVVDGKWGVMNKWICDPRWSWFGGLNLDGMAAVSSKFELSGNYSVDVFFATMMMVNDPPYEMIGNYGVSVDTDGLQPSSGMSILVAGGMNAWTGVASGDEFKKLIMRYDEKRRSDNSRNPYMPVDNRLMYLNNEVVHQRWYHVRVVRKNNVVDFWFENKLVHTINDYDDSVGRKVMLWTYRNGWLISRVRIAADLISNAEPRLSLTNVSSGVWREDSSRKHRLDVKTEGLLTTVKVLEPGPFALVSDLSLDLSQHSGVLLETSFSPGLKADLIFDYDRSTYRVRLTGPMEDDISCPTVGNVRIPRFGEKVSLTVPLRAMLEDYLGKITEARVSNLRIGQLNGADYAFAGFADCRNVGKEFSVWPLKALAFSTAQPSLSVDPKGSPKVLLTFKHAQAPASVSAYRVSVNGRTFENARFAPADDGLTFAAELIESFDLESGEALDIEVFTIDPEGHGSANFKIKWNYSREVDKAAPIIVGCYPSGSPLWVEDFENASAFPEPRPRSSLAGTSLAKSVRDMSTASSGRSSVKLVNDSIGGLMISKLVDRSIVIPDIMVLALDYKMAQDVPLSFYLGNREAAILFNDSGARSYTRFGSGKEVYPGQVVGQFSEPVPDGKWHTSWAVLNGTQVSRKNFSSLSVADLSFRGSYANDSVNFDNIRAFKVSGVPKAEPQLLLSEFGRIAEVRSSVSESPEEPEGRWKPGDPVPDASLLYYNVKVCDEAGNWSDTRSFQFFCDTQGPTIRNIAWKNGTLSFYIQERWGVDKSSLKVVVDGKTYTFDGRSATWTSNDKVIVYCNPKTKSATVEIADLAGNVSKFRVEGNNAIPLGVSEDL